jgi:hypothetical protein
METLSRRLNHVVSIGAKVSPVAFFLNILWFEGLLWVAWPSEDEARDLRGICGRLVSTQDA